MSKSFLSIAFLSFSIVTMAATFQLVPYPNPGVVEIDNLNK